MRTRHECNILFGVVNAIAIEAAFVAMIYGVYITAVWVKALGGQQ